MWRRGPELRNTHENWSRSRVTGQSLRGDTGVPHIHPPPTEHGSSTCWAQNCHPPTPLFGARFLPFVLPLASGSLRLWSSLKALCSASGTDRWPPVRSVLPDAFLSLPLPFLSHVCSPVSFHDSLAFTWPFFYNDSGCLAWVGCLGWASADFFSNTTPSQDPPSAVELTQSRVWEHADRTHWMQLLSQSQRQGFCPHTLPFTSPPQFHRKSWEVSLLPPPHPYSECSSWQRSMMDDSRVPLSSFHQMSAP